MLKTKGAWSEGGVNDFLINVKKTAKFVSLPQGLIKS